MEMKEGLGFEITELRLGLPGGDDTKIGKPQGDKKRLYRDISNVEDDESPRKVHCDREEFIANKSQVAVVGWPPVCSYRKRKVEAAAAAASKVKMYNNVKVSMDGAPFLRKIDLSTLHDYEDLKASSQKLFFHQLHHSGGTGTAAGEVVKSKNGESRASEYIIIYEDKEDGDWMLLGDVPWKMFVESCKRLRIMKKSDAERFKLKSENLNH